MASMEDRVKHSRRLKRKVKEKAERVRSPIAKELIVSGKYNQRVVKDKRGKNHDLNKMSFRDLIEEIQEE